MSEQGPEDSGKKCKTQFCWYSAQQMQESMHLSAWPDTSGLGHSSISIASELTKSITPSAGREKTKWSPWKKGNMHTPISVQKENKTEKNYSWRLYIVHRYIGFYRSEKHNFVWVKKWEFSLGKKSTSIMQNQLASLMLVFLHKKKINLLFHWSQHISKSAFTSKDWIHYV